ncbi:MAG: hypothetical protein RL701_2431 [Pseudomonadota bacterium]
MFNRSRKHISWHGPYHVYLTVLGLVVLLAACSKSPATVSRGRAANSSGAAGVLDAGRSSLASGAPGSAGKAAGATSGTGSTFTPVPVAGSAGTGAALGNGPTVSTRDPIAIDECGANNPAGLSAADVQKLRTGSGSAGTLKWLYPYDGTVFPRGLIAPLLMWSGAAAEAVYVHIHSKAFDYVGCLKPSAQGQLALDQDVWDKAGQRTFGKDDVYTVEFTTLSGGVATGPIISHLQIAQATMKGSIYYNSYSSKLGASATGAAPGGFFGGGAMGATGGLVLRIPAGGKAELFGASDCNGCHSVSANGSRLLTQFVPGTAQSYELAATGTPTAVAAGPRGGFGAFYPDGSTYLAMSVIIEVARITMTQGTGAPTNATLYNATTGQVVANQGIPTGALMPMFSPDGSLLAFNDYAIDTAHGLALMHYDVSTHTASNYKILMKEPAGKSRPGWPMILPDNRAVVFVRTDGTDFSGDGAGVMTAGGGGFGRPAAATAGPISELSIVDVATGTTSVLAQAMGYKTVADVTAGTTYLPFGSEELHHNYFPTLSPVAAGGYFWVFFDSIRHYGGLGSQRQLWGAAIDIQADGSYLLDPSHPAFYLPGQELGTGNHRAFAALDPCKKDGDKCTSGIDCCGGFCYLDAPQELVEPSGSCTPKMNMCAKQDERCTTDLDCCPPAPGEMANSCIAGFCAFVSLN